MNRRVVVTGVGLVTPLGLTAVESFNRLCKGEAGVKEIEERFTDFEDLPIKIAGFFPAAFESIIKAQTFPNLSSSLSTFVATAALNDSKIPKIPKASRFGIAFGCDKSSPADIRRVLTKKSSPADAFQNTLITQSISSISSTLGLSGYSLSISSGFATGQIAVRDSFRAIKHDYADLMLAGSCEADFDPSVLMSLYKSGLLGRNNEVDCCKPFDIARDGFVYSVGAGALVLEELNHALNRNADIYAEIVAESLCADENEAEGIERAMKVAVKKAEINAEEIGLVNADASGLKMWDVWEANAIESICKAALITSHKGSLGHMLSASSIAQNVFTSLYIKHQKISPVLNLKIPVNENLNYVCNTEQKAKLNFALSNSFNYDKGCYSSILYKSIN